MPKYCLKRALDPKKKDDMLAALALAVASSEDEIHAACANKVTGIYSIQRHAFLRQAFVTVFVRSDDTVADMHRHAVSGAGWTEHRVFVEYLESENQVDAQPIPGGHGKH